jgi:hypothetical protein
MCLGVLSFFSPAPPPLRSLSTAQLSGRVTDESSAVLPGVTVTATQTDTGFVRTGVTDDSGSYILSNLPTGPYRLEVYPLGLPHHVQTGIVLQVAASAVVNVVLTVGNLEESVTVEGAAPLVDVKSAGISDVVRNEEIVQLPLNGRNPVELVMIAGRRRADDHVDAACACRQPGRVGRRRPIVWRRLRSRRGDAQQPAGQPEHAVSVSRRAAGVQRRDERIERAERRPLGCPPSTP